MPCSTRLRIFVSAGADLDAERDVVGETIASLPVSLGWVIKYTPRTREPLDPALEAVAACHFYVLLMATDITAPVGSELYVARQQNKQITALLKDAPRTPAAHVFIRDSHLNWKRFGDERELGSLLQGALVEQILENAVTYGITPIDWENLSALRAELMEESEEPDAEREEITTRRRGAGEDAVIVAPERDLPSDGVLIEPSEAQS